ncbi:MAG: hypothetical protein WCR30_05010 [Clostridia bacterium]
MDCSTSLLNLLRKNDTFKSVASDYKNNLSYGYLFLSSDSFLVNNFAEAVANMIVCSTKNLCGKCESCLLALKGTHPDILTYPKGEKFLVSDSDMISSEALVKPMISEKKVFILNNFNNATEQAQNKLLKLIEEPPQNVVFLLTATNESGVLQTVRSRLSKLYVMPFSEEIVKSYLITIGANVLLAEEAIEACNGKLGGCVKYVQSKQTQNQFMQAKRIVCEMLKSTDILPFSKELSKEKENYLSKLEFLSMIFAKMLAYKNNINVKLDEKVKKVSEDFSLTAIIKTLDLINEAKKQFDSNVNLSVVSDKLLFGILEVKYKWK